MIGRTLSHYKILSEISRGGMGIVYRALDVKLDREVALKVLPPELVTDPERKRRFTQEAKAAAKLEHPHIGMVFEIDEADGTTFIAMELIRGEQLRDTIAKGPVPLRRALEIATDVAEGLSKAHDEGIVHRDLKPANIMVTEDGHTKIIDFGLAKLVEPIETKGSEAETALRGETDSGKVIGTVSYMSPEQARGQTVDHRTDIFSFGIVLFEILTGEPPFKAPSGPETLSAIINAPTPALDASVTGDGASEIERIVYKCLAKERAERYQGMKDLIVDLRVAHRRLESGAVEPVVSPTRRRPWHYAGGLTAAVLLLAGLFLLFQEPTIDESLASSTKPSLAVLYFENASGDPELDWLRSGLTDMLVTDLSQSPNLEVLSTDRLYQILKDMNRLDERVVSLSLVQEVSERANAGTVLLGSFMKAGETIRINLRIQDTASGKILTTEKVEGLGESSIFPMVDDLTLRVKRSLQIPASGETEYDRYLADVTTSSLEAYRYWMEAAQIFTRGIYLEAIPLLERAVELDPAFARALMLLSYAHSNLGRFREAEEYRQRLLQLVDHLPASQRLHVEGGNYARKESTYDLAIDAYEKALELDPNQHYSRHVLALRLMLFERIDEAIEQFEEVIHRGYEFAPAHWLLAECYAMKDEFQRGYEILTDYREKNPDSAVAHRSLGRHLLQCGKYKESLKALRKAEALRPGDLRIQIELWSLHILREEWQQAAEVAMSMEETKDPVQKLLAELLMSATHLYRGHSRTALDLMGKAADAYEERDRNSAYGHSLFSHVLVQRGQAGEALEIAQKAQRHGAGDFGEWEGLFLAGIAQMSLGQKEEAGRTAEVLRDKTESLSTAKEKRRYLHLVGELALAQGDSTRSVEALEKAQTMLPPRGFNYAWWTPQHVPIWFSLAKAHLAAGEDEKAAEWFQRISGSTTEHIRWPIPYVRSFYFLGKIHENRGEMDKAREYYRRFYEYWKDGDMDRERVEEARKKLAS